MPKLLDTAYEKELYERWLTIYPFMEMERIEYVSFEEYKNKALSNVSHNYSNSTISNEAIEKEMLELVKFYEQKSEVKKNGNI